MTRRNPLGLGLAALTTLTLLVGCAWLGVCGKPTPTESAAEATSAPGRYDAVPLIPLETLLGNPERALPAISPDGKRLAYVAPDEGVLNVWVRTLGKEDDKAITRDRKRGIHEYFWAEDGRKILYLQDKDGDENWHVYATPVEGGETRDLTPVAGVQARVMMVDPKHPNEVLVGLNDRDPQLHDAYRIDLKTGKRTLVFKNDIGAIDLTADHEYRVRVAAVMLPDGGIKVLQRKSPKEKWKELRICPPEDTLGLKPVGFDASNESLYWLTSLGANTTELRRIDLRNGKEDRLASDDSADVDGVLVHPTTHKVQAAAIVRARTEWKVIDPSLKTDFEALAKIESGDFEVVSRDNFDTTWIVKYEKDTASVVYYLYARAAQTGTRLFSVRPKLDAYKLAKMEPIEYPARDGLTIHGYLTTPAGVEPKGLPFVATPHGGPWYRDSWGYDAMTQWLANRGYAVLQMNFRGSTGYGKRFLNAGNREWGGKMQDDVTDGVAWAVAKGIADPKRVGIMGGSYGGYATLMGLVKTPELYTCGVDIVGPANLISWMQHLPPYWMPIRQLIYDRVGNPETDADFLKARSPFSQVDRIRAPLLIAQGANDPRVPKAESIQMRDALKAAGREVEYIEYADEGHGWARPENRIDFFGIAEKFLAKYLGGRTEETAPPPAKGAGGP